MSRSPGSQEFRGVALGGLVAQDHESRSLGAVSIIKARACFFVPLYRPLRFILVHRLFATEWAIGTTKFSGKRMTFVEECHVRCDLFSQVSASPFQGVLGEGEPRRPGVQESRSLREP